MQMQIYLDVDLDQRSVDRQAVTAILNNVHNGVWRHFLGFNGYHNYLLDLFEDLSAFLRQSDVSFYKHGAGDLCASWSLSEQATRHNIQDMLIQGIDRVNFLRKKRYLDKYKLINDMRLVEPQSNPVAGSPSRTFTLAVDVLFLQLHSQLQPSPVSDYAQSSR